MALSYAVYGLHEKCVVDYSVLARQVENEQCYWAAVGGVQRTASHIVGLQDATTVLKEPPPWFGTSTDPPPADHPANLAGVFFKVCRRAYATDPALYNVEDECGRINFNNVPSRTISDHYANRGGKESKVLANLLQWPAEGLSFLPSADDTAAQIDTERTNRITRQHSGTARGETIEAEDVFRHPYDLFGISGFDRAFYFGEDVNENGFLDPNENDENDSEKGKTYPLDDGDGTLDHGIRELITTFTNGKFNVYTCSDTALQIMLSDFQGMVVELQRARSEGRSPNPVTLMEDAGITSAADKAWFRAFRADYLTQSEKMDSVVRITVQAYQRDGTWRGTLEQVFKLGKDTSGSGTERYLDPEFKYYH